MILREVGACDLLCSSFPAKGFHGCASGKRILYSITDIWHQLFTNLCFVTFGDIRDVEQIGAFGIGKKRLPENKRTIVARHRSMHRTINRIDSAPFKDVGSKSLVYRHRNGVDEVSLVERRRSPPSISELSSCNMPRRAHRQEQSYNLLCPP